VAVDGTLSHEQVAWLVALRRSGVKVEWSGGPPPLAVEAERSREPVATTTVRLAADSGAGIVLADSVGVIDSVRASRGAMVEAPDVTGAVSARRGAWWASARVPAREERRDVLVLGRAGWEGRFLLDALGEAGWHVRARLAVAPGVSMVDASLLPIDTARYDAVVVLDSSAADLVPAMTRFVAQGGGAIIMGQVMRRMPSQTSGFLQTNTGGVFATVASDGKVSLWEFEHGDPVAQLTGHIDAVEQVVFSPGGKRLVSFGKGRTAKLWGLPDVQDLEKLKRDQYESSSDYTKRVAEWTSPYTALVALVEYNADAETYSVRIGDVTLTLPTPRTEAKRFAGQREGVLTGRLKVYDVEQLELNDMKLSRLP